MNGGLRQIWARVVSLFRKSDLDGEFDKELAAHIELAAQDLIDRGIAPQEARRLAVIKIGAIAASKEVHRDTRGLPWLESIIQDFRYALRGLRKNPAFTTTAIAILALGIGVNALVFSVTNTVLFKGFPLVTGNDRIVYITPSPGGCCASYPDFEDWRDQSKSFEGMAIVHGMQQSYSDDTGYPETFYTTELSANTFSLAGVKPLLGRDFTAADGVPGSARVAILRYSVWEQRYAKNPAVLGRTVRINGVPTIIVGVMPRGFSFPQNQDLWVPLVRTPEVMNREAHDTWFAFARVRKGVTLAQARAELLTIGKRLEIAYPDTNKGRLPVINNFHEFFIGQNATRVYQAMLGAVSFVLLIACANLANLMLVRGMKRAGEISVRMALGAGRVRILRQLLMESIMLAGLGGFTGWWIAKWGVGIFAVWAVGSGVSDFVNGTWFNDVLDYSLDPQVLLYLIAITIGTALLFGLTPALRLANVEVNAAMKDGGRGATGGTRGNRLSSLLLITEMALAVVLLAGAGVMVRSFLKIYQADLGIPTEGKFAALFSPPRDRYPTPAAHRAFYERLQSRIQASPGVESVALANWLPGSQGNSVPYALADAPLAEENTSALPITNAVIAGPGYFQTLGAKLIAGRDFHDGDQESTPPVTIVNQWLAHHAWHGENPVGKRIRTFQGKTPGPWLTVVGVTSNIAQGTLATLEFGPAIYRPYRQVPPISLWIIARARAPLATVAASFRREALAIDPLLPFTLPPMPLHESLQGRYQYRAVTGVLFLLCAGIALLLASVGLYAVIAHSVSRRTQEIGVRMAVGANARDILGLVMRQGMMPLAIGLGIGLAASLVVNRLLQAQLVQVSPSDPLTLAGVSLVLIAAALLGCWLPARRAMLVDPVIALRHE